ncbi:hydantoinase B/oxoprolinase family protein [Haliangium ochraceum]|uniref:5-oxoprolinase (ATP-hydrolyzing) n=1 Tax=Haliangium ochraceum (strain DSM 14365 / JCM 11303 / SMP-2) TaxID=502025 RepID=D0LQA0_HALO1|nr:hydantoinase B/oxoprolinase family protein [Haliangium ochraceum]ACY18909.1 5-oxoprolinase (ATP-hydrolyzing) [Haliangium ochraceum DSM 14365]
MSARWQFWIDRGGTFTDCLGRDPDTGALHTAKVLSSDRAPIVGIREILTRHAGLGEDEPIWPCEVRMGTTIATNALLERRGTPCALLITRGFGDLLAIGNQTRPEIFALHIEKLPMLYDAVLEIDARVDERGEVLARPDAQDLRQSLSGLRERGIDSLAVVVLHAYRAGELEREIGEQATALGFDHVSLSHEVAAEIGMVGRGDTTVVDAYLTPLIRDYLRELLAELPGSSLRIMQSSGGLTGAARFRGRDAVLSGPAGGVVAAAHVAREAGYERAIGFDMGGTSTDVSCYDGDFERQYENEVAGVRLRAPMMAIHTVAAGGGSLCAYRGFRLTVGPESAGAVPGPLCYGHEDARALALTDINLTLGRVVDDRFPFPLARERVDAALDALLGELPAEPAYDRESLAAGFFAIANASMAEAIRQVSVAKGRDVREYALVVFGGAGGQHACPIARQLGIRTLVFHRFAGVLSAYGMGLADVSWHGERDAGRAQLDDDLPAALADDYRALLDEGRRVLADEGFAEVRGRRRLDLRYRGTDSALPVDVDPADADTDTDTDTDAGAAFLPSEGAVEYALSFDATALRAAFERAHEQRFGYIRPGHPVEAMAVRVDVAGRNSTDVRSRATHAGGSAPLPAPRRRARMWSSGAMADEVPVYAREDLPVGARLRGPALVLDDTGTIAVDRGFTLEVAAADRVEVRDEQPEVAAAAGDHTQVDPVRLEIFNNVFMSIATQMGEVLRRTALSTNIRERLDFSCAVFDADGGLVANAPHIPVHLGAMGESIKGVLAVHPAPAPGSVFAINDPAAGGSHLPDVTVVTPVHDGDGRLAFFTASRGHHSDIGGITPGSMPPFSTRLSEEGAVFRALAIVVDGDFREREVLGVLEAGPHPARDPGQNIADLQAQVAANRAGAHLLAELVQRYGRATVHAYMGHVQDNAAAQVAAAIAALPDGVHRFEDALDEGARIAVAVHVDGNRLRVDFAGTSEQLESNLNAPRAVTVAALLYVLRALVGVPIPLNSGCLRAVTLAIPAGSLLAPEPDRAVAGGNVETSQRVVDVLLGALGQAAASQGTMNNLTFGNERFGYYETIAGGAGATAQGAGASGVHTHMTNTRITDPEVLETRFPVRLLRFSLRPGSGGAGRHRGGDGVIREYLLRAPMRVSILSERRTRQPFGLAGGQPGAAGRNLLNGEALPAKASVDAAAGDVLCIETPGGGGFGALADDETT